MVKMGRWDYPNDTIDSNKLSKDIRDEISKFCKKLKINKGKLVEEFYKTILMRFKDNSLYASQGYITMNLFREPIQKSIIVGSN